MQNTPTPLYRAVLIELHPNARISYYGGGELCAFVWGRIEQVVATPMQDGSYNFTSNGVNCRVYSGDFDLVHEAHDE